MAKARMIICPYCGDPQRLADHCRTCGGRFEALSRRASLNAMGPWFIRDERRPFRPGLSYETIAQMVEAGEITTRTIMRGPSTRQLWTVAKRVPGVAHLLGYCHHCSASVDPNDTHCPQCSAAFGAYLDRNYLGLPEVKPLPFEADVLSTDAASTAIGPAVDWQGAEPPDERLSAFGTDEELTSPDAMLEPLEQSEVQPPSSSSTTSTTTSKQSAPNAAQPTERETDGEPVTATTPAMASQPVPSASPQRPSEAPPSTTAQQTSAASQAPVDAQTERGWRLMQQRLTRQERMIRWLVVLMIIVLIASGVLLFVVFQTISGAPAGRTNDNPAAMQQSAAPAEADNNAESAASNDAKTSNDQAISERSSASNAPAYQAELQRAAGLLRRARDTSHRIASRLADYEQAIAVLRNVRENMPADEQPDDLTQRIETAKQERNALRESESSS